MHDVLSHGVMRRTCRSCCRTEGEAEGRRFRVRRWQAKRLLRRVAIAALQADPGRRRLCRTAETRSPNHWLNWILDEHMRLRSRQLMHARAETCTAVQGPARPPTYTSSGPAWRTYKGEHLTLQARLHPRPQLPDEVQPQAWLRRRAAR